MFGKIFGKKEKQPKSLDKFTQEELKEFQDGIKQDLRKSKRDVDRQIMEADRLIKNQERELKKKIQEGASKQVQKMYAKNVVQSIKLKERHYATKIKLQGVEQNINQMIMSIKMTKVMGQATNLMNDVTSLAKIPEISKNIMNLQMQLEQHGLIAETIQDQMEDLDDDIDVDDEVEKYLNEQEDMINGGKQKNKNISKTQDTNFDDEINKLAL